jgi:hypothetical protein
LFREFGQRWEIERVERGTEWVACRRDGGDVEIIGARDVGGLRFRLERAERGDAGEG